ncbi:uncharacterized protein LOC105795628 [Gossypium raimondii]|uniref:uncharacterized protein LOC105795628 n=1 Tax=Gossypium raimondii TaxID=29730 RepID=UPI00063B05F9|nr:uncharacterized protein LOC105795628 [Gossypium raimondii]
MVDVLATLASIIKVNRQEDVKPIQMSTYEALAHCYNIEEEERDDHPWYHDILRYVKNCEYPELETENDERILRMLANKTSIEATPFSLVYGIEAVLPIEVKIPSLRVLSELNLDEVE